MKRIFRITAVRAAVLLFCVCLCMPQALAQEAVSGTPAAAVTAEAKLTVVRGNGEDAPAYACLGDTVRCEITLENNGETDLREVAVSDTLLTRLVPGSVRVNGNKAGLRNNAVKPDRIARGQTAVISYDTMITEADILYGSLCCAPVVTALPCVQTAPETIRTECTAEIVTDPAHAGLTVQVTGNVSPDRAVLPGTTVIFTAELENTGNITLNDVLLAFPENMKPRPAGGFSVSGSTALLRKLPAGEKASVQTSHTASADDLAAGQIICCVSAEGQPVTAGGTDAAEKLTAQAETQIAVVPEKHRVTVEYRFANGTVAAPTLTEEIESGKQFSFESPAVFGAAPDKTVISGTMYRIDQHFSVIYKNRQVTLTVRFVDTDGRQVTDPYHEMLNAGSAYRVAVPPVRGLTPDRAFVEGSMPDADLVVTVTYR